MQLTAPGAAAVVAPTVGVVAVAKKTTHPSEVPSAVCVALADQPELVAAEATVTPLEFSNARLA